MNRLLKEKVFYAAYPVHDGDIDDTIEPFSRESSNSNSNEEQPPRNVLNSTWAKYSIWYKPQVCFSV